MHDFPAENSIRFFGIALASTIAAQWLERQRTNRTIFGMCAQKFADHNRMQDRLQMTDHPRLPFSVDV